MYYHPALINERIQGTIKVRLIIEKDGQLRRFEEDSWQGDPLLRQWVRKKISQALKEKFLMDEMSQPLELDIRAIFRIAEDASMFTYGASYEANTLSFYMYNVRSSPYDVTNGQVIVTAIEAALNKLTPQERRQRVSVELSEAL